MIRLRRLLCYFRPISICASMVFGVVLAGLAAPPAHAQAGRLMDWNADKPSRASGGWSVERFGAMREAAIRMQAPDAPEGAAARATLESADDKPPLAQLLFPVPFQPGHRYRVTVELSAMTPTRVDVMMRRAPAPYDSMALRSLTLGKAWQTVTFEGTWPITTDKGAVRVVSRQAQSDILIRRTTVDDLGTLPIGTAPQPAFPATLIGVHVNKLGVHNIWPQAGQHLIRLWDTKTTWSTLAPTPQASDDFTSDGWVRLDNYVDYVQRNQPETTILMVLGTPPRWASDNPDATHCAYGQGTCGGPASIDLWRHYVRTLAKRYKGRISHWELWNEADYRLFFSSSQSLAGLAKAANEELKTVDSRNLLISPGFTVATGINALQTFLQSGGGRHVDIIGYHWYFDGQPEKLAVPIQNVREVMKANGVGDKPLWNTEGAPFCQRRDAGVCVLNGLSVADQEAVAERAILTMWLNGVSAFAYYTVEGAADRTIPLLEVDSPTPPPAAVRMAMFSRWMVGASAVRLDEFTDGAHVLTLLREGKRFYIAWTESAKQPLKIPGDWRASRYQYLGDASAVAMPPGQEIQIGPTPVLILPLS